MTFAYTDPTVLKRQYADASNLVARASIYAFQVEHVDFPAWVIDHLPDQRPPGPVLDVGCGPGWCVARAADSGAPAIGLDLSWGMVSRAAASHRQAIGWMEGDAMSLPVRDRSCGAACALHMLYHVPDPARAVAELSRVVRPGGTVLVVLNGIDHMGTYRSLTAEAAGRSEWLPIPSDVMNLGHRDLFTGAFDAVVLDELRGCIVLRDIDPLLAYAASARDFYEHQVAGTWAEFESRLAETAGRHLARHDRIEITTHSGVFVCTAAG